MVKLSARKKYSCYKVVELVWEEGRVIYFFLSYEGLIIVSDGASVDSVE